MKDSKNSLKHYLSLNYPMSLEFDIEDGVYFVEFPDLPGCMSHGKTPDSAVEAAQKMKASWLELALSLGKEIPEPKKEEDYSGRITLRVPPAAHKHLAEQAQREERSLNQHLQILVMERSAALDLQNSIARIEKATRNIEGQNTTSASMTVMCPLGQKNIESDIACASTDYIASNVNPSGRTH